MNTTDHAAPSSQIELQSALDSASIVQALSRSQAIVEFDVDCNIVFANDNFLELTGYRLEEIVGQHHRIFCRPRFAESDAYAKFWIDLRHGHHQSGEFLRLAKGQRVIYIQASYNPVLDEAGNVCKIVKIASDITAAKIAALEAAGKIAAIDRSQGTIEFDLTGVVLSANENFLTLMDYTAEEIIGQHHRLFVDPKEAEGVAYRSFWKALSRGEFASGEFLRLGRDGKRIWIQATYNPILDLDGVPMKVVKFCSDITAAKVAAAETEARMAAVSSSHAIIEIGADRRVLAVNAATEAAMGFTAAELIGREERDMLYDVDVRSAEFLETWATLAAGKTVNLEVHLRGAGDRPVWLSACMSPVLGLDGQVVKAVMIGQDVTEAVFARMDASGKLAAIDRAQAVIESDLSGKCSPRTRTFSR